MTKSPAMPLIQWRKEFEVGVADIDAEHQDLIALINELPEVLGSGPDGTAFEVLGEIYARISAHFALEERLMRQSGYDEYSEHKADHEVLLDDLRDLMDDFEVGEWIDLGAFAARVSTWFSEHFSTRDARLHRRLHR